MASDQQQPGQYPQGLQCFQCGKHGHKWIRCPERLSTPAAPFDAPTAPKALRKDVEVKAAPIPAPAPAPAPVPGPAPAPPAAVIVPSLETATAEELRAQLALVTAKDTKAKKAKKRKAKRARQKVNRAQRREQHAAAANDVTAAADTAATTSTKRELKEEGIDEPVLIKQEE